MRLRQERRDMLFEHVVIEIVVTDRRQDQEVVDTDQVCKMAELSSLSYF